VKDLAVDDSGPPLATNVHDDPAVLGVSFPTYSEHVICAIFDESFTDAKLILTSESANNTCGYFRCLPSDLFTSFALALY